MHMADALLSPAVGGAMWAVTSVTTIYCARKVQNQLDNRKIPLMGVLGAFVFAAQMINFAIPGTGSSGHLGGGLFLAILLGPHAAFLTLASVLTIQALFFADGGLLALGSNIFNLGFIPCYIGYPLIYRIIAGERPEYKRIFAGSVFAAIISLQLGSLGVVLQTYFSSITALPFSSFLLVMQPIHLAIGLVEGIATAGLVSFIINARPEILEITASERPSNRLTVKPVFIGLLIATIITGGGLALFSSGQPDGLEWSIHKVAASTEIEATGKIHESLNTLQAKTSFMPDYDFKVKDQAASISEPASPSLNTGTSVSGIIGGLLVLSCSTLFGLLLKRAKIS